MCLMCSARGKFERPRYFCLFCSCSSPDCQSSTLECVGSAAADFRVKPSLGCCKELQQKDASIPLHIVWHDVGTDFVIPTTVLSYFFVYANGLLVVFGTPTSLFGKVFQGSTGTLTSMKG